MSLALRRAVNVVRQTGVRSFASDVPAVFVSEAEHKEWLEKVKKYKVVEPHFEFTLEFCLPSPIPLHVFDEPPILVEVANRNPDYIHEHSH